MKFKAALFDMDGTIIISEDMHTKTLQEVVKEKTGIELSEQIIEQYAGLDYEHKLEEIFKNREENIDHNKLGSITRERTLNNAHLVKRVENAEDIIKLMKTIFKIAVVTGSSREQADIFLEAVDFKKYFDLIVTASDVKNNKPTPDSYLLATKKLEVEPENCLVIEDSEPGIQASKSAGMICIGIQHKYNTNQDFSKADKVVNDISEIDLEMIKSLQ